MRRLLLVIMTVVMTMVLSACLGGDNQESQVSTVRPTPRITITPRPTSTLPGTTDTTTSGETGFVLDPNCPVPAGWLGYVVVSGDTLGAIADNINSTAALIQQNNCLTDETILVGQRLYLPSLPAGAAPISTSAPNIIVTSGIPVNCTTPAGWQPYTIVAGDTLGALADSINSSVTILQSANCVTNTEVIYVGQVIYLPVLPANVPTSLPGSVATSPPTCTSIPSNWQTYTVVAGDTLGIIAGRVASTITALQSANCLANADSIFVGQVLYVPPTTGGVSAPTAAPTFTPRVPATITTVPQGGNPPVLSQQTLIIRPTFQGSGSTLITLQDEISLEIGTVVDADRVVYYAGTVQNDPDPVPIGVDNDPFDGTRITYVYNDFDSELYFFAVAENEFGSSSSFQTHVVYDPTYVSASGKPDILPFRSFDSVTYTLATSSTVTITWRDAPTSAARVEFYLSVNNQTPIIIGTDANPANGSRITWEVPPQTTGKISAKAVFSNGSTIDSESVNIQSAN